MPFVKDIYVSCTERADVADDVVVSARVLDERRIAMPSKGVLFTISGGPNDGLSQTVVTNSRGVATITLTSVVPGIDVITVKCAGKSAVRQLMWCTLTPATGHTRLDLKNWINDWREAAGLDALTYQTNREATATGHMQTMATERRVAQELQDETSVAMSVLIAEAHSKDQGWAIFNQLIRNPVDLAYILDPNITQFSTGLSHDEDDVLYFGVSWFE